MSEIVDQWVRRLKGRIRPVGELTHWERLQRAFELQPTDLVPVAPELDYWQITYAGYTHAEAYCDADKCTDACIKTWADLRTDAIWLYFDISHLIEHFVPAEQRPAHFIHRGPKDYLLFKPLATTLDDAIALYESRAFERHRAGSRWATHYVPHLRQLLDFQEQMERLVPVIVAIPTPTYYAEMLVEVQRLGKWLITEPVAKLHRYLQLCLEERLAALDFFHDTAVGNGCRFVCCVSGGRTWGPRHLAEFAEYDRQFVVKAAGLFPHVIWHACGHNLPLALDHAASWDGIQAVQFDMPHYSQNVSWAHWCDSVARRFAGKRCAMNAPTTQVCCHGRPADVQRMVREFVQTTLPHTTAVVMPGCEVDAFTPLENVRALIQTARSFRPL